MPHGGGSHHHGGGGGFGGHHHHHHHHVGYRHHHRHNGGVGWYYGGSPYWYRYRRSPLSWTITTFVVAVVIIMSTVVTVRYTVTNYNDDDGLQYAPMDTRIIPVSKALCQGLTLTVEDTLYGSYSAQLYTLDSQPKLTGSERFSFNADAQPDPFDEFKSYYFYMYPGSNLTVTACISDGNTGQVTFYLIKGNNNYKKWQNDIYSVPSKMKFTISDNCQLNTNVTHSFKVTDEDYYYLIFDHDSYSTSTQTYMTFYRTLYELPSNSSIESCSVDTGSFFDSCSINVPLSGGKTSFLTVTPLTPDSDIDWTDGVGLDTTCSPRIWMYVVISVCSLLGLAVFMVPLLACAIICFKKKNKKASASTNTANTAIDTPNAPLIAPPPAANPNYQNPPAYGSNVAPPGYKV